MLLWIVIIVLTGAASFAVLAPLGRNPAAHARRADTRDVYLAQLGEIERDRAEGLIPQDQADAARAELARRLIALDRQGTDPAPGQGSARARRIVASVALVGIPAVSLALYLALGAPGLPGEPLAARAVPTQGDGQVEALVARVEEHLTRDPEDWRGWDVVAPVYLRMGRADDAASAYRNSIRIDGPTPARQTGLAQALIARSGGVVTEEARRLFAAASEAEPDAPTPRFYLALAKEQQGDTQGARADLEALLADAPPEAPWRSSVEQAIAGLGGAPTVAAPGPTQEQVAAAGEMDPAARQAMIEGMVDSLAARLAEEPDDVEGWLRLVRAYSVMGRRDDARNAAQTALRSISEPQARERMAALADDLGLDDTGAARQ